MFKNTTINNNSNGNSDKDSLTRLIFNKSPKRYNLATSLLTAGLLSALVACGGVSISSGQNDGNDDDDNVTAVNPIIGIGFNDFILATKYIAETTRYDGDNSDTDTTTLYIREGAIVQGGRNDALGKLPVRVKFENQGAKSNSAVAYEITSTNTFEYGSAGNNATTNGSNKVADYFTIDSGGNLKLAKNTAFDFGDTTLAIEDDKHFTFEVTASSGDARDTHTVKVQLGDFYTQEEGTPNNDAYTLSAGDDLFEGGIASDDFSGGSGNDTLQGGSGNDTLRGGAGNDTLFGNDDVDHLDILYGGEGNDIIHAGANDFVYAGDGDDVLYGGGARFLQGDGVGPRDPDEGKPGADKFVFDRNLTDPLSDTILDFDRVEGDKIVFENAGAVTFSDLNISYEMVRSEVSRAYIMSAVITYGTGTITVEGWDGTSDGKTLAANDFMFVDALKR